MVKDLRNICAISLLETLDNSIICSAYVDPLMKVNSGVVSFKKDKRPVQLNPGTTFAAIRCERDDGKGVKNGKSETTSTVTTATMTKTSTEGVVGSTGKPNGNDNGNGNGTAPQVSDSPGWSPSGPGSEGSGTPGVAAGVMVSVASLLGGLLVAVGFLG